MHEDDNKKASRQELKKLFKCFFLAEEHVKGESHRFIINSFRDQKSSVVEYGNQLVATIEVSFETYRIGPITIDGWRTGPRKEELYGPTQRKVDEGREL